MPPNLYSISFFIAWKMEKKQHPIFEKLNAKAEKFVNKQLQAELRNPIFHGKLTPDLGNPALGGFRGKLEDFKYEEYEDDAKKIKKISVSLRKPFGCENLAIQDFKDHIIGQYRLTFSIYDSDSSGGNRNSTPGKILREIKKIKVETDKGVSIRITDARTFGEVKTNDSLWPANASTEF